MEKKDVLEILRDVYDPDYRDRSIVDMGLVNEDCISIEKDRLEIEYSLTAPLCPFSSAIGVMIKYILEKKFNKRIDVKLKTGHPQERIVNEILAEEERSKELLEKLKSFGILDRCVRIRD